MSACAPLNARSLAHAPLTRTTSHFTLHLQGAAFLLLCFAGYYYFSKVTAAKAAELKAADLKSPALEVRTVKD